MWFEILDGNRFIINLYVKVPELKNVRIEGIKIHNEGRKVTIEFDMPFYAEIPPKRWMNLGFNSILVEVNFFDIHEINLQSIESKYRADIKIYKDEIDLINMKISGSLNAFIKADTGIIQSVRGYMNG